MGGRRATSEGRLVAAVVVVLLVLSIRDIGQRALLNRRASALVAVPARFVKSERTRLARNSDYAGVVRFEYVAGAAKFVAKHEWGNEDVTSFVCAHPKGKRVTA